MSYVIQAKLSNSQKPEYGQVTVPFPIQNDQYDQVIERLQTIDLGFSVNRDCKVDEIDSPYRVLDTLEDTVVNVDQLDYLAKRLDSFSTGEASQFEAMACKLRLAHIKDFINLTFCCQQATVITDFSDLEKVGRDHCMNVNGGTMPMEEYKQIDGRAEALNLIRNEQGTVTPYGVVYDNGMKLSQEYNGRQFPAYFYDKCLLALGICPVSQGHENQNPEYLYLPATDHQLERTLLRSGATNWQETKSWIEMDVLSEVISDTLNMGVESIHDLNEMCRSTKNFDRAAWTKLEAVVQMAEPQYAGQIRQLAENLDQFDFVPDIHSAEEYGRHMIQESGRFEYDPNLDGFYDYSGYGAQRIEAESGRFVSSGYVAYHGTLTLEELMMEDPVEQDFQMGGLS